MKSHALFAATLAMVFIGVGCESDRTEEREAAVETEPPAYVHGRLQATVGASANKVVLASQLALNNLKMLQVGGGMTADTQGLVTAVSPAGDKIVIDVRRLEPEVSRFGVSVGTYGDQQLATSIYNQILTNLQAGVASTPLQTPQEITAKGQAIPENRGGGALGPAAPAMSGP